MSPKIAVTANAFSKNEALVASLKKSFPDCSINTKGRYSEAELIEALKVVDGAIVGLDKITDKVLAECPNLKVIAKYGVGLDNIDLSAAEARGVAIEWEGGVNKRSVSELTLGFMLALIRNWFKTAYELKTGVWDKAGGKNLSGKTIGIIGAGHIGKDVIALLAPYECKILVNDIREDAEQKAFYKKYNCIEASREQIIKESDIISVHVPFTENTKHMVGGREFANMKPSAFVINTSRGGIIDESALLEALKNKTIAGAGLDVYEAESDPEFYKKGSYEELRMLPNVVTTPHIGGNSEEAVLAMGEAAIRGLKSYFNI